MPICHSSQSVIVTTGIIYPRYTLGRNQYHVYSMLLVEELRYDDADNSNDNNNMIIIAVEQEIFAFSRIFGWSKKLNTQVFLFFSYS